MCFTKEELCFWELPTHLRICTFNKLKLQIYLKIKRFDSAHPFHKQTHIGLSRPDKKRTKFFCRPSWIIYHILFYMISIINQSKPITENGKGKKKLTSKWNKNISGLIFKVSNFWFRIFENDVPGIRVNKNNDQFMWFNFHQVTKVLNHCLLKCKCSSHKIV